LDIAARTDVGRVRRNNEDSFQLLTEQNLFVLSDGMGGEAHGELASRMAVQVIVEHCLKADRDPSLTLLGERQLDLTERTNRLLSAVQAANRAIYEAAHKNRAQHGMGATVLAAWVDQQRLSLVHVGDSRAYLLRSGGLQQLTQDHSLVAEQVRLGILTPQEADQSEMQSVLTRALGTDEKVQLDAEEFLLLHGDTVLLCSDGLTRMVTDPEIASTLLTCLGAATAANRLVELANEYGGADNVTVIVFRVELRPDGYLARLHRWFRGLSGPAASPGGK